MKSITRYPAQLNGYTIAAVCRRVQQTTNGFNEDEAVIFGFDLTRRHSKFVTAYMMLKTEDGELPKEWVLGHYFEDLNLAMDDFLRRAALRPIPVRPRRPIPTTVGYTSDDIWRRLGEGI